jgi:hypothetical protein
MRDFFRHEIIQRLWWGEKGFFFSQDLKKIVSDLSEDSRK